MSFLFPLAAVKQQNKQIVLIDNIIILWSLRAKHIYLETTYLLITFRVYLSFLQWTSQKGCNVFLLKSESIMAIAPMSVCGSGGGGIKNPPLATYLDDSQLRYIVWVNVGVYFWFGLSFALGVQTLQVTLWLMMTILICAIIVLQLSCYFSFTLK